MTRKDAQFAYFAGEYGKLGLAGEDLLFGADNVDMNSK